MKASQRIIDDNLYPEDVLEKVALYKDNIFDKTNLLKMQGTVQENVSFKSNENFYSCFYERIVGKSEDYFQLDDVAVIISRKFGDQLLRFYKEKETSQSCHDEIVTKNLSDKEVDSLNYLAGYVLKNLYTKYKKLSIKNPECLEAAELVLAGKNESEIPNSNLIKALSRGGLWSITTQIQRLFVITEKYFLLQTHTQKRSVQVSDIVNNLIKFMPIQETFKAVAISCDVEPTEEVRNNVLNALLTLYLRIGTFSYAKDIVQKSKAKVVKKTKDAALRKNLKKQTGSEPDK